MPEELLSNPGLEVLQNGRPLTQDGSREGCWRLERVSGKVVVRPNKSEIKKINIVLGEELYLIFKLSGKKPEPRAAHQISFIRVVSCGGSG